MSKKLVGSILALLVCVPFASPPALFAGGRHGSSPSRSHSASTRGEEHVHCYTKRNGTRVHSHYRSRKDKTQRNNWETKGNINPSTGRVGTKTPKY